MNLRGRRIVILLTTALLITVVILVCVPREYFATITIQPTAESLATISPTQAFTRVDGAGVGFFEFHAFLPDRHSDAVVLEIRPLPSGLHYPQRCDPPDRGRLRCVGQLGGPEAPLHQNENYSFRVVDDGRQVYAEGTIGANVFSVVGTEPLLLIGISLLASLLQILLLVVDAMRGRESASVETDRDSRQEPVPAT